MRKKYLNKIYKRIKNVLGLNFVENVFGSSYNKRALLCYLTDPFTDNKLSDIHQNVWQIRTIAKILDELGYIIDVINYNEKYVKLKFEYDLVFDICPTSSSIYLHSLKEDSIKIVYFTGSNSSFANKAEMERIVDLKRRRGVLLKTRRQAMLTPKFIEKWDAAFCIGNDYNLETYKKEFNLPDIYMIPNTGYDFRDRINVRKQFANNKDKNCFLYFASSGCVHKGLDLVLEAFDKLNETYELYVCGTFKNERDFNKEYEYELYRKENIHPVGFIDIWGEKFEKIISKCTFCILPSCSEARAGAVLTMMSAGIIPICSKECGYNDDEVINLKNCKIDTIVDTIIRCSEMNIKELEVLAENMMKIVDKEYSRKKFYEVMSRSLSEVINNHV